MGDSTRRSLLRAGCALAGGGALGAVLGRPRSDAEPARGDGSGDAGGRREPGDRITLRARWIDVEYELVGARGSLRAEDAPGDARSLGGGRAFARGTLRHASTGSAGTHVWRHVAPGSGGLAELAVSPVDAVRDGRFAVTVEFDAAAYDGDAPLLIAVEGREGAAVEYYARTAGRDEPASGTVRNGDSERAAASGRLAELGLALGEETVGTTVRIVGRRF